MKEIREKLEELIKLVEEKSQKCSCAGAPKKPTLYELASLKPGDRFDTEIGKMVVLGHDEASGTTKVIQDDFYKEDVVFDSDSSDYTKSDLKDLFDGKITAAYSKCFGDALVEHEVHLLSVDMQDYGSFKCKVRPITFDEVREYNNLLVKKELEDWWWTCTPWSTADRGGKYPVAVVSPSGNLGDGSCNIYFGVRPVCILKSNIVVSKGE